MKKENIVSYSPLCGFCVEYVDGNWLVTSEDGAYESWFNSYTEVLQYLFCDYREVK